MKHLKGGVEEVWQEIMLSQKPKELRIESWRKYLTVPNTNRDQVMWDSDFDISF